MRRDGVRYVKQAFASPNPVIAEEEAGMLADVDRAYAASGNSQVIGRSGELPLLKFLERHLPYTLRPLTGHFVGPAGGRSPQIDIMIVDARYPLLAQNTDGSAVVMLHSLLYTIEVKTKLHTTGLERSWNNARECRELEAQLNDETFYVHQHLFAYRTKLRVNTLEKRYAALDDPAVVGLDVTVLRLSERDQLPTASVGAKLHFERMGPDVDGATSEYLPFVRASYTPLSDLYYHLVQSSYYSLSSRGYDHNTIGAHFNSYMTWATLHWETYGRARAASSARHRSKR